MSREDVYWRKRAERLEQIERIDGERIAALEQENGDLRNEVARLRVWRERAETLEQEQRRTGT